ncbi:MAG: hypothetical protein IKL68_02100 [Clostridia bacterium]|nr:hypothetical protein [Clostridia bacterium]
MKVLYGITEEDIKETRDWEEGRVTIDIEKKTIDFEVMHKYTFEKIKEYYDEDERKELDFKEIDRNFENIPFEDVFELKAFIDKANFNEQYYFYNKNDDTYIFLIQ